jgi:(2Fe-2S) ferredoxin
LTKPEYHLLLCSSSRVLGEPKGGCQARGGAGLAQYLESEVADRGLPGVLVSNTGCLKLCDNGPVLVVYPGGHWYGPVNEAIIDSVLDGIEEGETSQEHLLP